MNRTMPPLRIGLAALAFAAAPAARAVTQGFHCEIAEMTHIDGAAPTDNYSAAATSKLVLDGDTSSETRVLLRLPSRLASLDARLLAKATLAMSVSTRNYDGRALRLRPLTNAYCAENATWLMRTDGQPWNAAGGDGMATGVSAAADTNSNTVTWDLLPLLANADARSALLANGAVIGLDTNAWPAAGTFMRVLLVNPNHTNAAQHPDLFAVSIDPYADARDFALSYIDSAPQADGSPEHVFWEQGESPVGKILLNADGSECRAILSMPESLAALNPDRVQSVVARFDAEINSWNGEPIFLYPIATPTRLTRKAGDSAPPPAHGPSWSHADGLVDYARNASYACAEWTAPGGDWLPSPRAVAAIDAAARTATFDLTALWKDPAARARLISNGAIAVMDPACWPAVISNGAMPRVNLFLPDDFVAETRNKHSWMRVTEYAAVAGADQGSAPPVFYPIDGKDADGVFFSQPVVKVLANHTHLEPARALLTLPDSILDLDRPAVDAVRLRFPGTTYNQAEPIPVFLCPLTRPFGHTPTDAATWNRASTGEAGVAWEIAGGDFDAARAVPGAFSRATGLLEFDLAGLVADGDALARAAANGMLMRADESWTNFSGGVAHATYAMPKSAAQWVVSEKPVASTYIDSGAGFQNSNFSAKPTAKVLLNSDGTECRALMKLSSALLEADPLQVGRLTLLLTRSGTRSNLSSNPVTLHALSAPFRVGEATWSNAAAGQAWTTPGGDFLPAHVVGSANADGSALAFDLAGLLADADSRAALSNGVLMRMAGPLPSDGSLMANSVGSASAAATNWPAILQVPAELEASSAAVSGNGDLVFDVAGRNPLCDYELWTTDDLTAPRGWRFCANIAGGAVTLSATNAGRFYRIRQKP